MSSPILKYPFPYKAWLAMANDPDNTLIEDWRELHEFIWEELQLPFGDSLFVSSHNQNLPKQVNLSDYSEIGNAHEHDIIHTWGDFMHARKRGFDREDAVEAAAMLRLTGIAPKVWIDHASFVGNMIHGTNKGAVAKLKDSSGHAYENFVYSLDIARDLGIRYVWNGEVSSVLGQDRKLKFDDHKVLAGGSGLKASLKTGLQQLPLAKNLYHTPDNLQYYSHTFADGSELYCFKRYGTWQDADIDGLDNLINPNKIDRLLRTGGTSIVYSHLGKRHSDEDGRSQHIPESTRVALRNLKSKFADGSLMLSSVSAMLDYLVLRDNIQVDVANYQVRFRSDGIRFGPLKKEDLKGKSFSFKKKGFYMDKLTVLMDDEPVEAEIRSNSDKVFSIVF